MEKEKKFNILVVIFLLIQPILDVITSIQISKNVDIISISLIVRGIFLLISILYIYKLKEKKFLLIFLLYTLLAISYHIINTDNNIFTELSNIVQIFYLPILIFMFSKYDNKKIDDKLILIIYLIYLNLILIPYIFGIGFDITSRYINKKGYFGLFYFGNEISGILVGLLPITLNYVVKAKNYILKFIFYLELILVIYLVGTKTLLIGFILVLIYFYLRYMKYNFIFMENKKRFFYVILPILSILLFIIIFPKTVQYKNIKTSLDFYQIKSVKQALTLNNINNVVYSKRFDKVGIINNKFMDLNYEGVMYGLGKTKLLTFGVTEIDFLDIFFSIGIFGTITYFLMLIRSYKISGLRDLYDFSFFLFILMSLFSGHILLKPNVSIYIAILFILSKNSIKLEKKKIILVSNMYPSKKYKHYGVFVRNTEETLKKEFYVDKVVMYKHNNKFIKLFSYLFFYFKTILKGIFNNYDYIYVHFISHSSLGAIIVKLISKDTKLILNAHGNDIVPDLKEEEKNVKRSKKYIKYADKVVVPSEYFKNIILNDYSVKENKVYIYPSGGVNTKKFKKIDKEQAKKNCNLKKEYSYIGYISRFEKNKGFDVFLKAIYELKKENKINDKRFLIIGSGELENEFNKIVKDLNIIDYIEVRNMVSQDELVNIYNSLDIFVFPTYRKSESLGLVGLEALSCETFVISSDNYGPTDYMRNNKNGFTFKSKDEKDLKNKILKYYELNNEEITKYRKRARETALKYDVKSNDEKLLKIFE